MEIRTRAFGTVSDLAHGLLRKPRTIDELLDTFDDAIHAIKPAEVLDWLLMEDSRIAWLPGNRFVRVDALYGGLTLTHRISQQEIDDGILTDPVGWHDPLTQVDQLEDGSQISMDWAKDEGTWHVVGLGAKIQDCTAGTLCGLRVTDEGTRFEAKVEAGGLATDDLAEAMRSAFNAAGGSAEAPVELNDVLQKALIEDQQAWQRTIPPLAELAEAAGLHLRGNWVGTSSFDWDGWRSASSAQRAASQYSLTDSERSFLTTAVEDYRTWQSNTHKPTRSVSGMPAAVRLSESAVTQAFISALTADGSDTIQDLAAFAEHAAKEVDVDYAIGCTWIRAQAALADGDLTLHEALIREVLAHETDHEAANTDLAWLEFDRSNFAEAYNRLAKGRSQSPLLPLISQTAAPALSGAGRNEPCPCHSGRKFKACHGGRTLPFTDRIAVLPDKATRTVLTQHAAHQWWMWPATWADADEVQAVDRVDAADGWRAALASLDRLGLLSDILLIESGGLEQYLQSRGSLLPADETELLKRWANEPRRVWQVSNVDPETDGATLGAVAENTQRPSDDAEPETVRVDELPYDLDLEAGELIIGRPLPIGNGVWRLFGGALPIPEDRLNDALTVISEQGLTPEESARRMIDLGSLHPGERTEDVLYIGVIGAERSDLGPWLEQHVTGQTIGGPSDPMEAEIQHGRAYDDYMVVRLGTHVAVLTNSEEKHKEATDRILHDIPSAFPEAEQGVQVSVLQDEMRFLVEDPELLDGPDGEDVVTDLLDQAMLREAAQLLLLAPAPGEHSS